MMWPFGKRVEKRQGTSYSDTIINARVAAATGSEQGTAAGTAALETAASLYSRCFSLADVTPATVATRALTPAIMANIVREMILRGSSMYAIRTDAGRFRLYPVGSWDIRGGDDPSAWRVQTSTYGPTSSSTTKLVSYESVPSLFMVIR